MLLIHLPTALAATLLTKWLDIKFIAKLDTACCNRDIRKSFIELCQKNGFLFSMQLLIRKINPFLSWLIRRTFHVVDCVCTANTDLSLFALALSETGKYLRNISIDGEDAAARLMNSAEMVAIISQIAFKCGSLHSIAFNKCTIVPCVSEAFQENPCLSVVTFKNCTMIGNFSTHVANHHMFLRVHVENCQLTASSAEYFGKLAERAHNIYILDRSIHFAQVRTLVQWFHSLVKLWLDTMQVLDDDLVGIFKRCPSITILVLSQCEHLTDESIIYAAEHLQLTKLDIGKAHFTDAVLHAISSHCVALDTLLFEGTSTFTFDAIASVLRKCTQLTTIGLGWTGAVTTQFIKTLAPTLGNITTLILNADLVCNEVLRGVVKYCTKLKRLDISGFSESSTGALSIEELAYLLKHCEHLTLLVLKKYDLNRLYNGVARVLLRHFRQEVKLSSDWKLCQISWQA